MIYTLVGFILGFSIPYLARRYAKFMPATMAYALYRIFHINKSVSKSKKLCNRKYLQLKNHYLMRSLGWGIISSAILLLISLSTPSNETPWLAFFIIILLLLTEIDKRIEYLPDILTSPLLIGGFAYAVFAGNLLGENIILSTTNSSLGAIMGYLLPVVASLLLIKKHPDNFGGGDIKILAAIGAWLGLINIPYVIILSCIIFGISCFINKKRAGAFGPSIVLSALIILFILIYQ